ncbi:hypothetical protein SeMB42_g07314 [Synchytrium endobioticum]|uniref:Sugar phosphate phosphatase n=1 Tax=Synchytrium endobioticum TaxID=286115 RepID=A0A507D0E0_9FUNG|nr:hypothetical protein SeMB42_g07314 [Synchytrium endobioticum]TPX44949.1 hypothetical protein SeLEV6574_g04187 [Synchytrium endobioticum]
MDDMHALLPTLTPTTALSGCKKTSFAYDTLKDRMPVTLTQAIDELSRQILSSESVNNDTHTVNIKSIISALGAIRYDLSRDKPFTSIQDDAPDKLVWNTLLDSTWKNATWYSASWLFAECYMYRKMEEAVRLSRVTDLDLFASKKQSAFIGSLPSVIELGQWLDSVVNSQLKAGLEVDSVEDAEMLSDLLQFSLWGNQTDLSLLVHARHADMYKSQVSSKSKLHESRKNIIVDDLDNVVSYLSTVANGVIVFVLDNAGFELFSDLCLAHWLMHKGIAAKIVFHVKAFPWFVSDTTKSDLHWTLDYLSHLVSPFPSLVKTWQDWLTGLQWEVKAHPFFTTPYSYYDIRRVSPLLFSELQKADFVFFKGDLNYRKLVYDCDWETTTPFIKAIGDDVVDIKGAVLRTNKSDVCVGLESHDMAKRLGNEDPLWMVNGQRGVICTTFLVPKPIDATCPDGGSL